MGRGGKTEDQLIKLLEIRQQLELQVANTLVCICADCQKIRDDQGGWHKAEVDFYNLGIEFTHGFCPDCLGRRHLEIDDFILMTRRT